MQEKIIRFCYRKVIDAASEKLWERYVFDDTYTEFLMQSQLYNAEEKYTSFAQLLAHVPGTEKLHYLVSAGAVNYIKQLNGLVPDVLNALGKHFLPFSNFRFEIINSDTRDKSRHQVAINFYSDSLSWHDTIGTQLLVSLPGKNDGEETLTDLVSLQPFLSIYSIK